MSEADPAKRVPSTLGSEAKLFGRFTLADVAVALLPGVAVVLATQLFLPPGLEVGGRPVQTLTLPVGVLAIGLGALFVSLTPTYTSSPDWLLSIVGFHRRDRSLGTVATRRLPRVERAHPHDGAIERADGALLGVVEVDPPAMALATDDEWADVAEAFENVLSTVVAFPIELYATTRRFPVERYLARYESRLDDADVRANPRLSTLITRYIEWYADELASRRMTIREHYVVVPVTPAEVHDRPGSRLARLPLVGVLVGAWLGPQAAERHAAMVRELDRRLGRLEVGLRDLDGCDAHRVEAAEALRLVADFWSGESRVPDDLRSVLRTRPVIGEPR